MKRTGTDRPPSPPSPKNLEGDDGVILHDAVGDVHAGDDVAEDRVSAVEVRLGRVRDKELAGAGIRPGECHPNGGASVAQVVDFVADLRDSWLGAVAPVGSTL